MSFKLETERLTLSEMALTDLDFVAEMLSHPEVMRFYPKCYSRDEARRWLMRQLERYALHGFGLWLVSDRHTDSPIGQVGLVQQEVDGRKEREIGYLIHRPYWRNGYATEAAGAVKTAAFVSFGFSRVISLIRPENIPSQGVARRLGMAPEKHTLFNGLDHIVFSVSKDLPS